MNEKIVIARKLQKARKEHDFHAERKVAFMLANELHKARLEESLRLQCEDEMLMLHFEYNMVEGSST